ncbi:MAG TPA: hypothetical protein VKE41_23015 [Roseiflexaceae bacterium]|nr:hypothetical protein [Roseiflexaceae bacterium]
MSLTNAIELERALLRSGDDIYRLALLLAADESSAARALIKATRQLAISGAAPDESALIAALLRALPSERRRWRAARTAAWARPRGALLGRAELLAALAGLPRRERLALGLTMLRSFEPEQAGELLGEAHQPGSGTTTDAESPAVALGAQNARAARTRAALRDALLALAPVALAETPQFALDGTDAPEACRPTRAALALNDPALHSDAAIRGHLALCSACRSAEHAWQSLSAAVEEALRGALRDIRLPPALADQLQVAAQPTSKAPSWAVLSNPRVRIALVALPVLALIAFLVWPRGATPSPTGRAPALAQAPQPRDLVQRARDQLYAPLPGQGVWHGRYEIQWAFPDNTTALLAADAWIDPASGRHRLQLVHHSGGGPYEFELADGASSAWYAISENYVSSLYPLSYNQVNRVQLQATPEQQRRMLDARLVAGAWGLAGAYLRQAETAELRAWGRQRDADGALLDLISFNGMSPLALPPDAPDATTSRITVLLAIDEASGRLREVRELIGPAGSEQTTRTTWRQVSEQLLDGKQASERIFTLSDAWNGVGAFSKNGKLADPAFPLVRPEAVTSLMIAYQFAWTGLWMPATPPPGASAALLLNHGPQPIRGNQFDDATRLTFVYIGDGRRLEIGTYSTGTPLIGGEVIAVNNRQAIVLARNSQGYLAQINHNLGNSIDNALHTTQVAAFGYTRAELLQVLRTLGSPTLEAYLAQARLFADPGQHDRAALEALIKALSPRPAVGTTRHFVERVYKRQDGQPDPLPDPYHRPRYGGWPEQVIQDNWARGDDNLGTSERAATTMGADGKIYGRQYLGPNQAWYYDALASRVSAFPSPFLQPDQRNNEDQNTILRMIGCGGARMQTSPNGLRSVVQIEENWRDGGSCMQPDYAWLYHLQTTDDPDGDPDQGPYLADRNEATLTTLVGLDANGRAVQIQTWAGPPATGTLLQSWELVSEESLPAERVPASTFDARLPVALQRWIFTQNQPERPPPSSVTITQALELAQTPLFELPTALAEPRTIVISETGELTPTHVVLGAAPSLLSIIAGAPPDAPGTRWDNNDQNVFEQALQDGFAIRMSYSIADADGNQQTVSLYQGSEQKLGAYLRSSAVWKSSSAESFRIRGKPVNGWRVIERRGSAEWIMFDLGGTLIAVQYPSNELLAALTRLQPVTR